MRETEVGCAIFFMRPSAMASAREREKGYGKIFPRLKKRPKQLNKSWKMSLSFVFHWPQQRASIWVWIAIRRIVSCPIKKNIPHTEKMSFSYFVPLFPGFFASRSFWCGADVCFWRPVTRLLWPSSGHGVVRTWYRRRPQRGRGLPFFFGGGGCSRLEIWPVAQLWQSSFFSFVVLFRIYSVISLPSNSVRTMPRRHGFFGPFLPYIPIHKSEYRLVVRCPKTPFARHQKIKSLEGAARSQIGRTGIKRQKWS